MADKDKLETILEEARQIANQPGTMLLPDDWDVTDNYLLPSPPLNCSNTEQSEPEPARPKPPYSSYMQEKIEEYYDKYILD